MVSGLHSSVCETSVPAPGGMVQEGNLQAQQTSLLFAAMLNRRMLICVMTGLASGMPLYLLIQLVPAWLRAAEVSLAEIGLFALVGLPYTWKFLWAP